MIDNYDSFTYNLVQYFQLLNQNISVFKHDEISISDIKSMPIDAIVISPGPNAPKDAGISVPVIQHFYQNTPILGVCLGHQAISYAFGGKIISASEIKHGKASLVKHNGRDLFYQLANPTQVIRYHSLMVDRDSLPDELKIDATTDDDTIMAISHKKFPLYGIQFHPESFLTTNGLDILKNFTNIIKLFNKDI
jgi:anthranilate synthase component 2